ncbi:hypothetical protein [Streptomyces sp. CBMA152]|uniref:hypothetical protein n=1 Tax=Streptomyces sp. CBMA152 TaxID=1896312 RepID=UPI00166007E6|nr:hypothetical protein [Streptomyces sp. CBMA152]MBD0743493.1 hypothetical protein [Streptomyces sp. CBMA152]
MTPPTNPIARLDAPLVVVEAEAHLLGLLAHPVAESAPLKERHDWFASVFRDLATAHPEACSCDADYPDWQPGRAS